MTISFPAVDSPVCSVVILAWRVAPELVECLTSLTQMVDAPPFEVVIVLNGSTPAVRSVVESEVTGAVVVDLAANIGFGGGCNAGAAVARGSELVFLNDDTIVGAEWLKRLHGTASATPGIGAVASLLLNPSGTVQESGSRVLQNAFTMPFGRNLSLDEAGEAGLLERRPVDYGSAAALLVPTEAFRQVAGFDPAFEPAYFEDVDLQFRLKAAGLAVILEPAARVTHISGASTSGAGTYRQWAFDHSVEIFRARWAAVLPGAAVQTDPPTVVCPVPNDALLANDGRTLPPLEYFVDSATATALQIAAGYASSITARYEAAVTECQRIDALYRATENLRNSQVAELSSHLTAHVNRVAELSGHIELQQKEIERIEGERDAIRHRLHDLDTRGPVGLLRWRGALVIDQLKARQR